MAERRILVLAAMVAASVCACSSAAAAHNSRRRPYETWSAVGMPASGRQPTAVTTVLAAPASSAPTSITTRSNLRSSSRSPRSSWAPGPGAPSFPLPASVDQRSADVVAVTGARAAASADTLVDHNPQHTAVRAARAGWLTTQFARNVVAATIVGPPSTRWTEWTRHRAYVAVTARLSGDDHLPDAPTGAARMVLLTERPVGRDGWRGNPSTVVVAVLLKKVNGVWRIDSDQRT
ncbi:MAG: hypothetical protein QOH52_3126 [Pseudonocardiales bacterium]|nr:hypothetical protein [Pseudonocardiales bacterium]